MSKEIYKIVQCATTKLDIAISLLEKERERNIYQEEKGHLHFKKRPFFPLMDRKRGMRYRKRSHQERDMWCHKKPARLFEIGNAVIEEHGTFKCQEKSQFKKKEKKIMQVPSDRLEMLAILDAMPAASDSQRCCMSWRDCAKRRIRNNTNTLWQKHEKISEKAVERL